MRTTRRGFLISSALASLSVGALSPLAGCGEEEEEFTVVVLPDTQEYANLYPEIYDAQTKWIVDNQAEQRIEFVTHLGDIVDAGPNLRQWKNAKKSMSALDSAGVPYGTCIGNHDFMYNDSEYQYGKGVDSSCNSIRTDVDCAGKDYLTNFGPKLYQGRPWYGGASPSGLSSYQTFSVGGLKFLFLHLEIDPRPADLTWAQGVLDKHPDAAVHLSTHRYMYDYRLVSTLPPPLTELPGGRFDALAHALGQFLYHKDGTSPENLFKKLISTNTNIFMVHCGHIDAELRQVSKNAAGLPVHEILVDYQTSVPLGGGGWMRLLKFNLTTGKVNVRSYSPYLNRFRTWDDGLDDSIRALRWAMTTYSTYLGGIIDLAAMEKTIKRWETTQEGRKEFYDLLFQDGRRDPEFSLDVDFAAYPASRATSALSLSSRRTTRASFGRQLGVHSKTQRSTGERPCSAKL